MYPQKLESKILLGEPSKKNYQILDIVQNSAEPPPLH